MEGRVAIITGATSGLGRATAIALSGLGCTVVVTGRRTGRLQELAHEITERGGTCDFVAGDAANPNTSSAVVTATLERHGRIDILINNAGQGMYKPLHETTEDDFDSLVASNLKSTFLFTKAVAPHFVSQRSGVIVFVSSVAGLKGAAQESVYSATKFAQIGFAQSVDEELRPHGIQVCSLCPGGMKTEFAIGAGRTEEEVAQSWMMDAAAVADAIAFVCTRPTNVRLPELVIRHMGKPLS